MTSTQYGRNLIMPDNHLFIANLLLLTGSRSISESPSVSQSKINRDSVEEEDGEC